MHNTKPLEKPYGRLKSATPNDAPAIAAISVDTWRSAFKGLMPDPLLKKLSVSDREKYFRNKLEKFPLNEDFFVIKSETEIEGFIGCGPCADFPKDEKVGEIFGLYVRQEKWGTGRGKALLSKAISHLKGMGCKKAVLWSLEGNERAESFYEREGWQFDGAIKNEILGEHAIPHLRYTKAL